MSEYIEREALLHRLMNGIYPSSMEYTIALGIAEALLRAVPVADVVPVVRGTWTLHEDGSGTCSNCKRTTIGVWDVDNWHNYCPHCGAKMEGGPPC